MIKKVTIKSVGIKTHKRVLENGVESEVAYMFKNGKYAGKNFVRVSIQTEETGDEYYASNAFPNSKATALEAGQKVILKLVERTADDGKVWRDFMFPTQKELEEFALNN